MSRKVQVTFTDTERAKLDAAIEAEDRETHKHGYLTLSKKLGTLAYGYALPTYKMERELLRLAVIMNNIDSSTASDDNSRVACENFFTLLAEYVKRAQADGTLLNVNEPDLWRAT